VGCKVRVMKYGLYPQVATVESEPEPGTPTKTFDLTHCPCSKKTLLEERGGDIWCVADPCPNKIVMSTLSFCINTNIALRKPTIQSAFDYGCLNDFSDLFELKNPT